MFKGGRCLGLQFNLAVESASVGLKGRAVILFYLCKQGDLAATGSTGVEVDLFAQYRAARALR
ncbi:hypothetical protein D3C78_1731740 [compost metagenome]